MTGMTQGRNGPHPAVSRTRYERERRARHEAETLLEAKSRQLYEANQRLVREARRLERAVRERTAELEASRHQAEAANAAKSAFLAHMSHEIRTPLNGILGTATALTETSLSPSQHKMLAVIVESGDLLLSVLNDILDLSKIEADRLEIETMPFDLTEAVGAIERLYRLKAEEKGLELAVEIETESWITGDPTRLRQVLGNLLSNAVKFTDRGQISVNVRMDDAADAGGLLRIEVSDTGIGISPEQMSCLFIPYNQADAGISRRYGGSGLGLAISRRLCRMLGGDLVAESRTGKGSLFTATMRVARVTVQPKAAPLDHERRFIDRLASRPLRVLAAEDNLTNQLVLKSLLSRYDLRLEIVANGQALLDAWKAEAADVILMDVAMPVMSGIDATKAIRRVEAEAGLPRTPIVALSANVMLHQIREYLACGMDLSVAKPIAREKLIKALVTVLPDMDNPGEA
ncbi:ATP-binding protein [Paracoccus salsus]|uniref:ATP-binding protein n=1 Tax=Paracoccus salsus TaxID=2911061 RepID=UPI001F174C73|nr:ATP-binding protein [Paracoccus salsus]MCF3973028.1 ATP-binding protein [Paracoccus salsus]